MSQSKLPQHHQHGHETASRQGSCSNNNDSKEASCSPAQELNLPPNSKSSPPMNQLSQDDIPRHTQQQLLMLRQQQEQLRFLEEQLRIASMQDIPSRSSSSSRKSRHSTSSRCSRSPRVEFCEDVFCYTNPRDYEEIVSSWYSKDELAVFKGEKKELIRALKKVNFDLDQIDRNVFHLRGLEPYLSVKYNKYMQKKRTAVMQTVMIEQMNQRGRGIRDAESLRAACCEASAWARERAADLGRRDAQVVGYKDDPMTKTSQDPTWGHESDVSSVPSLCSSQSGSTSTHSSIASDISLDSFQLNSPSIRRACDHKVTLERVDELPSLPYQTIES